MTGGGGELCERPHGSTRVSSPAHKIGCQDLHFLSISSLAGVVDYMM